MGCQHLELTISNMLCLCLIFIFEGEQHNHEKIKVQTSQIEQAVVTFLFFMEFMLTFSNNRTI